MHEKKQLVSRWQGASLVLVVMAFVWVVNVRALFVRTPKTIPMPSPFHLPLARGNAWIGDVIFYGWIVWSAIALSRMIGGREWLLFVGFFLPLFLFPLGYFLPELSPAFRILAVACYTLALVTAILIFRDRWLNRGD